MNNNKTITIKINITKEDCEGLFYDEEVGGRGYEITDEEWNSLVVDYLPDDDFNQPFNEEMKWYDWYEETIAFVIRRLHKQYNMKYRDGTVGDKNVLISVGR